MDFYKGDGTKPSQERMVETPLLSDAALEMQTSADQYRLVSALGDKQKDEAAFEKENTEGLRVVRAVNTALALRMPLLVSGEPGSGKTQLGYSIAHELGKEKPFKFNTKSTSVASDLFYTYDAVRHFQARENTGEGSKGAADASDFIEYNALGLAILLALEPHDRMKFLPDDFAARDHQNLTEERQRIYDLLKSAAQHQTVVVIDEIDKAPLDFPNDLLHEIENLSFRVPELGGLETPKIKPSLKPIIVITTNSNRQLPDAFLRRCAYATIIAPTGDALQSILDARLEDLFAAGAPFLQDVRKFYEHVRREKHMHKSPGTSELLQFLQAARAHDVDETKKIADQLDKVKKGLSLLGKREDDLNYITEELGKWTGD